MILCWIKASVLMKSRCCINNSLSYEVYQIVDQIIVFKLARITGCGKGNICYSNFEASDYQVNIVLAMIFLLHAYFSLLSYLF